jgi:hypothetical protein
MELKGTGVPKVVRTITCLTSAFPETLQARRTLRGFPPSTEGRSISAQASGLGGERTGPILFPEALKGGLERLGLIGPATVIFSTALSELAAGPPLILGLCPELG